jgi:hypothetical protein
MEVGKDENADARIGRSVSVQARRPPNTPEQYYDMRGEGRINRTSLRPQRGCEHG